MVINFIVVVGGLLLSLYFGWALRTGMIRVLIPLTFFVVGFGFAYLLDGATVDFKRSLFRMVAPLVAVIAGYLFRYLYDVRFQQRLLKKGFVKAIRLLFLDFRVVAVLIGLLVSVLMSFIFYDFAVDEAASVREETGLPGFWVSFYTNWIASVLFFAVVGLIAGLTALYRPERDVFAARVQILLGGKSGPAVDYIANELAKIGYVSRLTERYIEILEYSSEMNAFKVMVRHKTCIKNLYHDRHTNAVGKIAFNFDELTPEPPMYGALTSFRIDDAGQPDVPMPFSKDGISRSWSTNIAGDEEGVVSYEHWC